MGKKKKLLLVVILCLLSACTDMTDNDKKESLISTTLKTTQALEVTIPTLTNTIDPTIDWLNQEIEYGKNQAQIIIIAIEEYYIDHLEYPESLELLLPDYLEELPLTISEDSFFYVKNSVDIYIVYFNLTRRGGEGNVFYCGYSRGDDLWECGVSPQ